jgi:hypothetical protein
MEAELVTVWRITITKAEIVHKTTKTMEADSTKGMAPDQNLRISRVEAPNGKGATFGNLF